MPLVSVLIPVYQAEQWLDEALASAFSQTVQDFEVVAVDDGSTDRSPAILREWALREPRLRVISASHADLPRAREISLENARGRFAAFLDADDIWLPHRLERQLPLVDDATVVFSDVYVADASGTILGTYAEKVLPPPRFDWPADGLFHSLLWSGCFVPMPSVLAPIALLREAGSFRRAEHAGFGSTGGLCDFEMWLTLALGGTRFHYVQEPLAIHRAHGGNISADPLRNCIEGMRIYNSLVAELHGAERREVRRARRRMRKHLEVEYRKLAWSYILGNDRLRARASLFTSLQYRPQAPRSWLALLLFQVPPLIRVIARRGLDSSRR